MYFYYLGTFILQQQFLVSTSTQYSSVIVLVVLDSLKYSISPSLFKLLVYLKVSANLPLVSKVGLISNLTNSIGQQLYSLFLVSETLRLVVFIRTEI